MPKTLVLLFLLVTVPAMAAETGLTIHEWGTFTSLQDETGRTIGGINSDDEPVPQFVHTLAWDLLLHNAAAQKNNHLSQGWPRAHPHVTMRLETPVLYVHPAPGAAPTKLDVSVEFRGGWLTQFFPDATAVGPRSSSDPITSKTLGRLSWKNLSIGASTGGPSADGQGANLPKTDAHVWLTPRNVESATLTTPRGESEKYLFYRGVGHIDAPLTAKQHDGKVELRGSSEMMSTTDSYQLFNHAWLARFDADGSCFAEQVHIFGGPGITMLPVPSAKSPLKLPELRAAMKTALIQSGLHDDEAEAMLATWELSYFKSPGLRVFYIVPNRWVDKYLPLTISVPAEVKRVMVGRLELIMPQQRALLEKITSATDVKNQDEELWKAYDQLGRFRNALVLDEQKRKFSTPLHQFITAHGLQGFAE